MTIEAEIGVMQLHGQEPKDYSNHQKLGEWHKTDFSTEPSEGISDIDNLIFDFWPPEQ